MNKRLLLVAGMLLTSAHRAHSAMEEHVNALLNKSIFSEKDARDISKKVAKNQLKSARDLALKYAKLYDEQIKSGKEEDANITAKKAEEAVNQAMLYTELKAAYKEIDDLQAEIAALKKGSTVVHVPN